MSQSILDMGDDFQPDAMSDFDARVASGEFKDLSMEQIRQVYLDEEQHRIDEQEEIESIRATEEAEERMGNND